MELPLIRQVISHKIHGPDHVGGIRYGQFIAHFRLDVALGGFFGRIEEAPRMALRITMGAGKTRGTMQHLQPWLAQQYGKQVEIHVPRHDLADQYARDLKALDGGICAEIIHHYPRTGGPKGDLPILCLRPDYVRSLEAAKIGVFQAACCSDPALPTLAG